MRPIEQKRLAIGEIVLEIFVVGEQQPVICTTHPFVPSSGNTLSTLSASPYLQALSHAAGTLVVVNPRGMGQSSPLQSPVDATLAQLVEDLEAIRSQPGMTNWIFAGGSSGGDVGLLYALSHPQALQGLIILSTAINGPRMLLADSSIASPKHPLWAEDMAAYPERAEAQQTGYHWDNLRPGLWVYLHDQTPIMVVPLKGTMAERQRVALELFATASFEDRLREIAIPTLVLCGRRDPIIPLCHCEELRRIPNAELVIFDKSEHDIAENEPELLSATIQRFITERIVPL